MGRRNKILRVFCGIDWAEAHRDVALVDDEGTLIAKRRISDDAAGFAVLIMLLADAGDSADDPIPVAIETSRGLLVACLRARADSLCDQPDGGVPLSGSVLGGAQEIRCR
jgi:Transposase